MAELSRSPEWLALKTHAQALAPRHMRDLFAEDKTRLSWGQVQAAGLTLDFTKNRMTRDTLTLLTDLAKACDLAGCRDRMASGEAINLTEGRAALHMALRGKLDPAPVVDGRDASADIVNMKAQMLAFVRNVHDATYTSATGKRFETVVNIGIGGSDLGPRLACDALRPFWGGKITPHFVANVDATELTRVLDQVDPETTLFVIASKSFTTQETMRNAQTAKEWVEKSLSNTEDAFRNFVAVTANSGAAQDFGIRPDAIFEIRDWVGGRYSVWSSAGLSVALALGVGGFEDFLGGATEMDRHFMSAPLESNLPILLALIGIWNHNFLGYASHAVLPYDQSLSLLPSYLQQLEMESNGKTATRDGKPVEISTAPIIWGSSGTNGQHAFYQWLHQGTDIASADIIVPLSPAHHHTSHHDILVAHAIAQAEALAFGRDSTATRAELVAEGHDVASIEMLLPHRIFAGNRPVSTIMLDALTPQTLGALLALYEHKVFSQGIVWNINSFDQWGVELGKTLASTVLGALAGEDSLEGFDQSTREQIKAARKLRRSDGSET